MTRRQKNSEQELSSVLDSVHQVPCGEGTWENALTAIADFLGAQCADLTVANQDSSICLRVEHARIDTQIVDTYLRQYMSSDVDIFDIQPRVAVLTGVERNQVLADSDLWNARQKDRMTFFREFYQPNFHHHECVMGRATSADDPLQIYLTPHFQSTQPQQSATRNRLRMLLPHVRRAALAEATLGKVRKERDTLSDTLDRLSEAVALIDRNGRIVRANAASEAVFGRVKGIDIAADGRLLLGTAEARLALAAALGQCASPLLWTPGRGALPPTLIAVPRFENSPLLLTLQPLPKELCGAFGAVALLFINDPDLKLSDRTAALRTAYGLSPAEARLVQSLSEGLVLKEIANRHGVSYETARTQLRRVMEKTGTRRQADVVRLHQNLR